MDGRGAQRVRARGELPARGAVPARLVRRVAAAPRGARRVVAAPSRARFARGVCLVARHRRLVALPGDPRTSRRGAGRRRGAHCRRGMDVRRSLPRGARPGLRLAAATPLASGPCRPGPARATPDRRARRCAVGAPRPDPARRPAPRPARRADRRGGFVFSRPAARRGRGRAASGADGGPPDVGGGGRRDAPLRRDPVAHPPRLRSRRRAGSGRRERAQSRRGSAGRVCRCERDRSARTAHRLAGSGRSGLPVRRPLCRWRRRPRRADAGLAPTRRAAPRDQRRGPTILQLGAPLRRRRTAPEHVRQAPPRAVRGALASPRALHRAAPLQRRDGRCPARHRPPPHRAARLLGSHLPRARPALRRAGGRRPREPDERPRPGDRRFTAARVLPLPRDRDAAVARPRVGHRCDRARRSGGTRAPRRHAAPRSTVRSRRPDDLRALR